MFSMPSGASKTTALPWIIKHKKTTTKSNQIKFDIIIHKGKIYIW